MTCFLENHDLVCLNNDVPFDALSCIRVIFVEKEQKRKNRHEKKIRYLKVIPKIIGAFMNAFFRLFLK